MTIQEIIYNFLVSAAVSGGVIFLAKTYLTEKIKASIKNEYDQKLEAYKTELKITMDKEMALFVNDLKEQEKIKDEKWLIKRDACLEALDLADAALSNMDWDHVDAAKIVKQEIDTVKVRACFNKLACSCDNPEVLSAFKKAVGRKGKVSGDIMTDFRNIIRSELGFGDSLEDDRSSSFFARVQGDKK